MGRARRRYASSPLAKLYIRRKSQLLQLRGSNGNLSRALFREARGPTQLARAKNLLPLSRYIRSRVGAPHGRGAAPINLPRVSKLNLRGGASLESKRRRARQVRRGRDLTSRRIFIISRYVAPLFHPLPGRVVCWSVYTAQTACKFVYGEEEERGWKWWWFYAEVFPERSGSNRFCAARGKRRMGMSCPSREIYKDILLGIEYGKGMKSGVYVFVL